MIADVIAVILRYKAELEILKAVWTLLAIQLDKSEPSLHACLANSAECAQ